MDFKELLELLVMYSYNMKVIHWNSTGEKFDRIHALADQYHNEICSTVDTVGEIIGMLDEESVPSFADICSDLGEASESYIVVDGNKMYEYDDGVELIDEMLGVIASAFTRILENAYVTLPEHVGIKSTLEAIQYEYAKEKLYFNSRRQK